MRRLRERDTPRHLWLVPLKDLAFSAVWLSSWLGRSVVWSGQRLRIRRDGRVVPVEAGLWRAGRPRLRPGETPAA
jgi:hypothetical protein